MRAHSCRLPPPSFIPQTSSSSIIPLCNILPPYVTRRHPPPSHSQPSTEPLAATTAASTNVASNSTTSTVDADASSSSTSNNSAFYQYSSSRSTVDKSPMCRIAELARFNKVRITLIIDDISIGLVLRIIYCEALVSAIIWRLCFAEKTRI